MCHPSFCSLVTQRSVEKISPQRCQNERERERERERHRERERERERETDRQTNREREREREFSLLGFVALKFFQHPRETPKAKAFGILCVPGVRGRKTEIHLVG